MLYSKILFSKSKRNVKIALNYAFITVNVDTHFLCRKWIICAGATYWLLFVQSPTDMEKQKMIGFPNFSGFLWVVNASYYSMFYMARALLEKSGIQIKQEQSIHLMTFDALIYFFYITGKLKKSLIERFIEANEEAAELLGREKADQLVSDYFNEKAKRGAFTYEMGAIVMRNKAKTSLERANNFNKEIKRIIGN